MEIRRLMRRSGDCLQGVITTKENFSETLTPKSGRGVVVYERLILYRFDQENVALEGLHLWEVVLYKPSRRPRDITSNA